MARHGYTRISDQELRRLGFGSRTGGGKRPARRVSVTQGQEADPERRQQIEQYAIKQATVKFTQKGWRVRDRSKENLGYDLALTAAGRDPRYVEVKGSTGRERAVRVTPGEVNFARDHPAAVMLYVLHSIKAEPKPDGTLRCSGGTERLEEPFEPADERLTVVTFSYALRPSPSP